MSLAQELLAEYAHEDPADGDWGDVNRWACAPAVFDALKAVLSVIDAADHYGAHSEVTALRRKAEYVAETSLREGLS